MDIVPIIMFLLFDKYGVASPTCKQSHTLNILVHILDKFNYKHQ